MKRLVIIILLSCVFLTASVFASGQQQAQLFAKDTISDNGIFGLSFSPDGKQAYFVRSHGRRDSLYIMESVQKNGSWQKPTLVSFSGIKGVKDIDPFVSPDGKFLLFNSNRSKPSDTSKHDFDIWLCRKTKNGWSSPLHAGDLVNSDSADAFATMARNGNIYFGSNRAGGMGNTDIYVSHLKNGKYQTPVNLGPSINTGSNENNPYISPGEDFLIFNGSYADQKGDGDLYISFKLKNGWSKPMNLGSSVNSEIAEFCPSMIPGKNTLYFCRLIRSKPFVENAYSVDISIEDWRRLSHQQ